VDPAGRIDYPLLGPIQVQGLHTADVVKALRSKLAARYVRDPKITVAVSEMVQRTITVDGAVGQPGVFPVRTPVTLIQAIALARGTNERANESRVLVFRTIEGQRTAAAFDLRSIRRAQDADPMIYPSDVVVVLDDRNKSLYQNILQGLPVFSIFRPF
jgi:polysaccharide export outer membrane protein